MTRYYVYEEEKTMPDTPEFMAYLDRKTTAIVSIDMHEGHLSERADCPCPAPRGRNVVSAIDAFHAQARNLGVPVIHVVSTLRLSGIDDSKGIPAAWRLTMPEYFGPIPEPLSMGLRDRNGPSCELTSTPATKLLTPRRGSQPFTPPIWISCSGK